MMQNRVKEVLMSIIKLIYNAIINFSHWFLVKTLKCGPIPKHVAFIMDGNRRWARNHGMDVVDGHDFGAGSLDRVIIWLSIKIC